jgi:ubiquitin C-terminal hydrolase
MDSSYTSLNKLFNDYFEGRVSSTHLHKKASSIGFGNHPLIQEIFHREAANRKISSKPVHEKGSFVANIIAAKGIKVQDLRPEKIEQLAESILAQDFIEKNVSKENQLITSEYEIDHHGLPNLGNTCFANSVLQTIFATPDVESLIATNPTTVVGREVRTLLTNLYTEYKKPNPDRAVVTRKLDQLLSHPLFTRKGLNPKQRQEDAHEFYAILAEAAQFDKSRAHSVITESLDLHDRIMHETPMASTISLPREDGASITIQDWMTRNISSRETDVGVFRRTQYSHPHLDELKSIAITLPRFSHDRRKSLQPFHGLSQPITLPVFDETSASVRDVTLKPTAVICHYGDSSSSGHYVTFVDKGTHFEERSDSFTRIVTRAQAEAAFEKNAYLVQYAVESISDSLI